MPKQKYTDRVYNPNLKRLRELARNFQPGAVVWVDRQLLEQSGIRTQHSHYLNDGRPTEIGGVLFSPYDILLATEQESN